MSRMLCFLISCSCLISSQLQAQQNVYPCAGTGGGYASWCVGGHIDKYIAYAPYHMDFQTNSIVKVCKWTGVCSTTSVMQRYDYVAGRYYYDQWEIRNFFTSLDVGHPYWIYAWNGPEQWGDETRPSQSYFLNGTGAIVNFSVAPRPIDLPLLSPLDGSWFLSYDIEFEWDSGIDAARNSASWPASYDVYIKYWGWNQTEGDVDWELSFPNTQCNPNSRGHCSAWLYGMAPGYYRWKVVRKLDVTASTNLQAGPTGASYFSVSSNEPFFQLGMDWRPPGCCR